MLDDYRFLTYQTKRFQERVCFIFSPIGYDGKGDDFKTNSLKNGIYDI